MRAWCNGSLIPADAPAIAVLDHGFTVGDGVFEAIKVVDSIPFALTRHLDRLGRSAAGLGLPVPDAGMLREAIADVLRGYDLAYGQESRRSDPAEPP
jgi:branched-chain amino acid aminotransferase